LIHPEIRLEDRKLSRRSGYYLRELPGRSIVIRREDREVGERNSDPQNARRSVDGFRPV
jgi:hypothetical protein